jgi:hypothetical protein
LVAVTVKLLGLPTVVEQAISNKYGKPTSHRSLKQTSLDGKPYTSKFTEWKLRDGSVISVQEMPTTREGIFVNLSSAAKEAWFRKVNSASPKAKKDI